MGFEGKDLGAWAEGLAGWPRGLLLNAGDRTPPLDRYLVWRWKRFSLSFSALSERWSLLVVERLFAALRRNWWDHYRWKKPHDLYDPQDGS